MATKQARPKVKRGRPPSRSQTAGNQSNIEFTTIGDGAVSEMTSGGKRVRVDREHKVPPGDRLDDAIESMLELSTFGEDSDEDQIDVETCEQPAAAQDISRKIRLASVKGKREPRNRKDPRIWEARRECLLYKLEIFRKAELPDLPEEDSLVRRMKEILRREVEVIDNPLFKTTDEVEIAKITAPMPKAVRRQRKPKPPKGIEPYFASLYDVSLLEQEQEEHLFRQYNYFRRQMARCQDEMEALFDEQQKGYTSRCSRRRRRLERLCNQFPWMEMAALEIRNYLIRANLRLVVNISKKYADQFETIFDAIYLGNLALIRSVELFDFSKGNRFSTYASWGIINRLARGDHDDAAWRARVQTGQGDDDSVVDYLPDCRDATEAEDIRTQADHRKILVRLFRHLKPREVEVITLRFGLGEDPKEKTLEQVGRYLGITRERVRQIQDRALLKLGTACEEEGIDLREVLFG